MKLRLPRIRVWHFVVLPPLGMAFFLTVFRLTDPHVLPHLSHGLADLYRGGRTVVTGLGMASLIAWLAVRYRRAYEAELQARNEALTATRDFLSQVIDGAAEAIVTLDARGRVVSWNRAAHQIYGWAPAEMLGQRAIDVLVPDDPGIRAEAERREQRLHAGETLRDEGAVHVRQDGKRIEVRLTRSPLYDGGGVYQGSTGIIRDVTLVKEMETRLAEQQQLAAVGELAAIVAHEVRNPLAGIRGGCEIMLEGYVPGETRHEIGTEILRQVDRLNHMVQDLLLYARPRALTASLSDLHQVLDRCLSLLREDLRGEVEVVRRFDREIPPLPLDVRQMEQVFLNVLQNAVQAINGPGRIVLATRRALGRVEVVVSDSGPGIAPATMERIFKPFFTTKAQGTGLGLAIVRNIVHAHGGTIQVANPESGGAEFVIALPCASEVPA
ncbi:MAG TPA: ATP-binding protein [Candidatus Polarisedimenticolaceae bacterium]|nr:ATP-binding protein [Candidatus Polarisedimenticolaceae bacterium]